MNSTSNWYCWSNPIPASRRMPGGFCLFNIRPIVVYRRGGEHTPAGYVRGHDVVSFVPSHDSSTWGEILTGDVAMAEPGSVRQGWGIYGIDETGPELIGERETEEEATNLAERIGILTQNGEGEALRGIMAQVIALYRVGQLNAHVQVDSSASSVVVYRAMLGLLWLAVLSDDQAETERLSAKAESLAVARWGEQGGREECAACMGVISAVEAQPRVNQDAA